MGASLSQQLPRFAVAGTVAALGLGTFLILSMKSPAESAEAAAEQPKATDSSTAPAEQGLVLREAEESHGGAEDSITSLKKAARQKTTYDETQAVDVSEIKGLTRGGKLGPGRYLFRAQVFWQEILPEQVAVAQLEFSVGLDGGKNFARIPQERKGTPQAPAPDSLELIAAAVCVPSGREDEAEVARQLRGAAGWGDQIKVRRMLASAFVTSAACSGALCESALGGHEPVVKELLRGKASPSSNDGTAKTALHMACAQGHEGVAKLLIEAKADMASKDGTGQTPCELAREQDMGMMAKRLEKFAAGL